LGRALGDLTGSRKILLCVKEGRLVCAQFATKRSTRAFSMGIGDLSMRASLAIAVLAAAAFFGANAFAGDVGPGSNDQKRAFWLADPLHSAPGSPVDLKPDTQTGNRYSKTYTDELADQLGFHDGKADFFETSLNGPDQKGPKIGGSFDSGAAEVVLRWHPDE
jgi:hypothetical protein